jgi:hypothetical protein
MTLHWPIYITIWHHFHTRWTWGATLLVLLYFIEVSPPNDVRCHVRVVGRFYSVPATWTPDLRQPSPPPFNDELSPLPYLSYLRLMIRAREGIYVTSTHERANARACIHITTGAKFFPLPFFCSLFGFHAMRSLFILCSASSCRLALS